MAYDVYLLLEGNIYTKVADVTAETQEDVELYDASTYRDELNASFLGAPPTTTGQEQVVLGVDPANPAADPNNPGSFLVGVFDGVLAGSGNIPFNSAIGTNATADTYNAKYFDQSDSYTHTAPRYWKKKRSRYKWTTATGMYWAWADQIISVSKTPFGFIGATLPSN